MEPLTNVTVNCDIRRKQQLPTLIKETDSEADAPLTVVTHTYTYDSNNNMTSLIEDDDTDANGNIDERITTNHIKDEGGNMTLFKGKRNRYSRSN